MPPWFKLQSQFDHAMKVNDKKKAERLSEKIVESLEEHEVFGCRLADSFATWAKFARERKDYAKVVAILERYLRTLPNEPSAVHECKMPDLLDEARERLRRYVSKRGSCEMCGNSPRLLTRIDSGHVVCRTCLTEFKPAEKAYRASAYARQTIKLAGLTLSAVPTPEEVSLLMKVAFYRSIGLADDATDDEVKAHFAPKPKIFHTKVAGVTHLNYDGMVRQVVIERCYEGECLVLIREPGNPFNLRAVKVCRKNGDQLGYLGDHIVGDGSGIGWSVSADLDAGSDHRVVICGIRGEVGKRGVNIHVTIGVPPSD